MAWDTFVFDNINKQLIAEGFPPGLAQGGAAHGADYYRRMSQASKRGAAFDDCLFRARQFVLAGCPKKDKPVKKKQSRTAPTARPSLL